MRTPHRGRAALLISGLMLALAGCSATYTNHGFTPPEQELAEIVVGVDTQDDVATKVGRPADTGLVDDDAWYYLSSRVRSFAFYDPVVTERRLVAIQFDEAGFVRDVTTYGMQDGRAVELVTRTTETYGQELTVVQQFLGNLFNFEIGGG
ncbi:MAG: outer membrane protein assembly factor BamE [Pseudomonadota bacterium]